MADRNQNRPKSFRELPQYLHAPDIALLLGIAEKSVYALAKQKDFPVVRLGYKLLIVDKDKLREWLERPMEASE